MNDVKNDTRIPIEGIGSVADLINKNMKADQLYTYQQFWEKFVIPSELECEKHDISYWNTADRHIIKKGVNEEFGKRKIPKMLFVRKDMGFFLLDAQTGIASRMFLKGVQKVNNANQTHIERCYLLADSNGLPESDKRLLRNTAARFDDNKSALAGTIGRMTSVPKQIKLEAMKMLGVYL